jgi:hypothetical protein
MNYEWGPWVEHDGKGYPASAIGNVCQIYDLCINRGLTGPHVALVSGAWGCGGSWNWANWPRATKVIRYRVRRPLVSEWLAETTSDLPVTEDA